MPRRFQIDVQGFHYVELWRTTRSWRFLGLAFTKLLRGFRPSGAVIVHAVPFGDFEQPSSALLPDVLEALAPMLASLREQSFAAPLWQVTSTEGGEFVINVATLRHERLPAIARIIHSRDVVMGNVEVSAWIRSVSERSGGIVTTSTPHRFASPPTVRTFHLAGAPPERLMAHHAQVIAGMPGLITVPDDEALRRVTDMAEEQSYAWGLARGRYVELEDGVPPVETAADPFEAALFSELARAQRPRTNWAAVLAVAVVSLMLFVGLGGLHWNWRLAGILAGVVLIHEGGHWVAMRAFGYKNMRMFFLPLLGAAVSGENWNVPAWKKAVVALAGPIPGIAGALGLMASTDAWNHPVLFEVVFVSLLVNHINLLPVMPLDGGAVVQAILFSRHPTLETGFRIVAVIAGISAAALGYGWVWAMLGVLMIAGIKPELHEARATARLRAEGMAPAAPNEQGIPRASALQILSALEPTDDVPRNPYALAPRILSVYGRLNSPPPRLIVGFLLLLLHAGGFAAAVAGASWHRIRPGLAAEEMSRWDASPVTSWATWSEGAPAHPSRTHLFTHEVESEADAVALAASLRTAMLPGERLTRFGRTILVATSCDRVEHWSELLAGAPNLAPASSASALFTLTCKAGDADAAGAMVNELMLGRGAAASPRPPWTPVLAGGEDAAARIRRAFRLHDQASTEAQTDPEVRRLQAILEGLKDFEGDAAEQAADALSRAEALARMHAMRRLIAEAPPDAVDLVVAKLLMAQDESEDAQASLSDEERVGTWEKNSRELAAAIGSDEGASGDTWAVRIGDQVRVTVSDPGCPDSAVPLIAGWLSANGCEPLRYLLFVTEAHDAPTHRCTEIAN